MFETIDDVTEDGKSAVVLRRIGRRGLGCSAFSALFKNLLA